MNRVLIKLYVPSIEEQYDIWIPLNKNIYTIITMLTKAINELTNNNYEPLHIPFIYNKVTGEKYDVNAIINNTNIRNGTELVLI